MRSLLPAQSPDVDLLSAYSLPVTPRHGRPFVRCNMISSIDGAITSSGRSGHLGGDADRELFQVLRSLTDVVLVGAGTMRGEHYGPPRTGQILREQRVARGQRPTPRMAVVTRSAGFDWGSPFFADAEEPPIIFVPDSAGTGARDRGAAVAEIVEAGTGSVEPAVALQHLSKAGYRSVLLEGGPGLNSDFVRSGLMDELCLTVSPRIVSGPGPRLLAGPELAAPLEMDLLHLLEQDGFLFYRLAPRWATRTVQRAGT